MTITELVPHILQYRVTCEVSRTRSTYPWVHHGLWSRGRYPWDILLQNVPCGCICNTLSLTWHLRLRRTPHNSPPRCTPPPPDHFSHLQNIIAASQYQSNARPRLSSFSTAKLIQIIIEQNLKSAKAGGPVENEWFNSAILIKYYHNVHVSHTMESNVHFQTCKVVF